MSDILAEAEKAAVTAAKEAGKIILKHYKSELKISFKENNPRNIVTEADKESDKEIRQAISKAFPSHSVMSEEAEPQKGDEYTWYIDPIDGTTNFSRGREYFCVSIALAKGSDLLIGVVYNPLTGEFYTAAKGKGAFLNGKQLRASEKKQLIEAMVGFDMCYEEGKRIETIALMRKLVSAKSMRLRGSAALALCEIASGHLDGYAHVCGSSWDFAAGVLLVREAGGAVTDLNGKDWEPKSKGVIAASSKEIAEQMLAEVRNEL